MELTYGADCEVFLHDGMRYRSAIGRIGGSKEEPLKVAHGNLQEDNVLAEFAIDPADAQDAFILNIHEVYKALQEHVSPMNLIIEASADFDPTELTHPEAQRFGCDPDFNAWTYTMNQPPDPKLVGNLRTCGAHIHVGFPEGVNNPLASYDLGRIMDVTHGIPSVLLDTDNRRRAVYGKAGAVRTKEYGVEYRTLSNFWIKNQELMEWAFSQIHAAYQFFKEGLADHLWDDMDLITQAINTVDRDAAYKVVEKYGIVLP